jgi:hypothetical protein
MNSTHTTNKGKIMARKQWLKFLTLLYTFELVKGLSWQNLLKVSGVLGMISVVIFSFRMFYEATRIEGRMPEVSSVFWGWQWWLMILVPVFFIPTILIGVERKKLYKLEYRQILDRIDSLSTEWAFAMQRGSIRLEKKETSAAVTEVRFVTEGYDLDLFVSELLFLAHVTDKSFYWVSDCKRMVDGFVMTFNPKKSSKYLARISPVRW